MPTIKKVSNTMFDVEKFDGKISFKLWQVEVQDVLILLDLDETLKGKHGKPTEMSDDDWEEFDLQACGIIRSYLTEDILSLVLKENSAASIWAKLENLYMKKSLLGLFYLKKQLFNFRMKEGTSMSDHLNDFNQLVTKFLDFGVVIEDEDKALHLLISLPDKYDHFVGAILYGKKTITYNEVSMALLEHDLWKELLSLKINSEGEGLVGRRRLEYKNKDKGSWKPKRQKNVECYNCHKIGHIKVECPSLKDKDGRRKY